ncbi:hypothetical protein Ctob_000072 [Chrysochromulina tobinii]|uniref:Uncharacterized protein n=1 Tax=Chrysochromulina tobinii TaxID=1460289 RepID=A0A0M0J7J2_9EUKA|nr:hypothetical protein Ctob_000072 [Chrysochromulina tobinii]|eukprot:KOO22554.1 hypothetical protein Ctob_000072 [Chrysochromulina sp. CCMP291]
MLARKGNGGMLMCADVGRGWNEECRRVAHVVLEQLRVKPGKGSLKGPRERSSARVTLALFTKELDDASHHEQGRLMATVPIHNDCAEHDVSPDDDTLDA